jgi:hypothetical protein
MMEGVGAGCAGCCCCCCVWGVVLRRHWIGFFVMIFVGVLKKGFLVPPPCWHVVCGEDSCSPRCWMVRVVNVVCTRPAVV